MMNPIDLIGGWLRTMLGVDRFEGHSAFLYDGRIGLSVDPHRDVLRRRRAEVGDRT